MMGFAGFQLKFERFQKCVYPKLTNACELVVEPTEKSLATFFFQISKVSQFRIVFKKITFGGQNEIEEGPVVEAVPRKKKACSSK